MTLRTTLLRAAPVLALGVLLAATAGPALAQSVPSITGGVDPVQTGRNALTLIFAVLAILLVAGWGFVGASCWRGRVDIAYIGAAVLGTMLIAGAYAVANRVVGGGGLSL
jgi:hypothetical protein